MSDSAAIDWSATRAVVCGFGVSGFAAADTLLHLGADVVVLDQAEPSDPDRTEQAHLLEMTGDTTAAREAYLAAARRATNLPQQRYLNHQAARLGDNIST